MAGLDEASLRTLRWRVEGLPIRLGQILLIGSLFWLYARAPLPLWWGAAAAGTAVIDADLSRRWLARLDDWRFAVLTVFSRVASAGAFAAVCFVLLSDRSGLGLAAAMLVGCAMNLNNAVMTRGSRRFFLSIVAPSSICLVALPLVAWRTGHPLSGPGAGILTVGAVAYAVFIALLARALFRESEALRAALEAAEAGSRARSAMNTA
jgi:hypothetical protein